MLKLAIQEAVDKWNFICREVNSPHIVEFIEGETDEGQYIIGIKKLLGKQEDVFLERAVVPEKDKDAFKNRMYLRLLTSMIHSGISNVLEQMKI